MKQNFYRKDSQKDNCSKLFTNCIVVDGVSDDELQGEVLVIDGVIAEIADKISDDKKPDGLAVIDCGGNVIAPGLVEVQTHIGEPGGGYKENIEQTTKAAVAGGVTTINIMPDTKPAISTTSMVEYIKNRAEEKAYCNVSVFGSITKNLEGEDVSEYGLLKKSGVRGLSEGIGYVSDAAVFYRACQYASNFNLLVAHQPAEPSLTRGGVINEGKLSTELGVQGISYLSEVIALQRDLAVVEKIGVKYHCLNVSSGESVKLISDAKKKQMKVTCSVTPHHLLLDEGQAYNYRTFAKTFPPLRRPEDREALLEGVKGGDIDFISCNNSPRAEEQKRVPLENAEFGVIGLETLFAASYTALKNKGLKLAEVVRLLTSKPASFLGVDNIGKIEQGCVADLILIDINEKWRVDTENFAGKSVNSPFDGFELEGKILKTYIHGNLTYEESR